MIIWNTIEKLLNGKLFLKKLTMLIVTTTGLMVKFVNVVLSCLSQTRLELFT